jgi:hypothetical protein
MATINYAESFSQELQKKYSRELCSYALTQSNPNVQFINAQTIKLPTLTLSGYKDHSRQGDGFNTGSYENAWIPVKLDHDRDIEFRVDPMDVDETNLVLSVANITSEFEEQQAIPEKDSYRYSKLYAEAVKYASDGAHTDTTALTEQTVLSWFDDRMEEMDDAGVPLEGRILYCTATIKKLIKRAQEITRTITVDGSGSSINRTVNRIDDVEIVPVPSARFKTLYDFTNGCAPASSAKQMNAILVHPSCVVSRDKYAYIHVFQPGHDSRTADSYIYQNRYYTGTFLLQKKAAGIAINVSESSKEVS